MSERTGVPVAVRRLRQGGHEFCIEVRGLGENAVLRLALVAVDFPHPSTVGEVTLPAARTPAIVRYLVELASEMHDRGWLVTTGAELGELAQQLGNPRRQ